MRTPEQLLKAYEAASKENPLVLDADECDNFSKAMKISNSKEDKRLGKIPANLTLMDKDVLLKDGIKSPIDQQSYFTNRKDWNNHLKANGCIEYGNDLNNHKPPKEMRGDFDCRKELTQATNQIAEKYGH